MAYESDAQSDNSLSERLQTELELLERHIQMLQVIRDEGPVGIIKLSEFTGFPQHKVRYSLRVLEGEGLIRPSPRGATITDRAPEFIIDFKDLLGEMEDKIRALHQTL
jgi:predicted transcriptional regulator